MKNKTGYPLYRYLLYKIRQDVHYDLQNDTGNLMYHTKQNRIFV